MTGRLSFCLRDVNKRRRTLPPEEYVDVVRTKLWQEWLNSSVRYGRLRPECSCRSDAGMLQLLCDRKAG